MIDVRGRPRRSLEDQTPLSVNRFFASSRRFLQSPAECIVRFNGDQIARSTGFTRPLLVTGIPLRTSECPLYTSNDLDIVAADNQRLDVHATLTAVPVIRKHDQKRDDSRMYSKYETQFDF